MIRYTFEIVFIHFRPQIKLFVQGLFDLDNDISAFKEHLRDFLIQIKVSDIAPNSVQSNLKQSGKN